MILGYVAHIESALNLDVDFGLPEETWTKYHLNKAVHNDYYYVEDEGELKSGCAHRTRLRGVSVKKDKGKKIKKCILEATLELKRCINRSGGFVLYHIRGLDVFGRIIADIYDPISKKCLNDIFLEEKYELAFKPYTRN